MGNKISENNIDNILSELDNSYNIEDIKKIMQDNNKTTIACNPVLPDSVKPIDGLYKEMKKRGRPIKKDKLDKVIFPKMKGRPPILTYEEIEEKKHNYGIKYYKENKNKIVMKIKCECGMFIGRNNMKTHLVRKIHARAMMKLRCD